MGESKLTNVIKSFTEKENNTTSILDKQVRFSISLSNLQSKKLDVLVDIIGLSKQEFIAKVLDAAMIDLEGELNLIDSTSIDTFGHKQYHYKTKYVREILAKLGITEDEWYDMRSKNM